MRIIGNNKHVALLLGAGFSVPAGMPTATILNSIIKAKVYDSIRRCFKNGEDGILQSYILEKTLIDYDECYPDFNYEQYFDFLKLEKTSNFDKDKLLSFIERGMYGYFWKCSRGGCLEKRKNNTQIKAILGEIEKKCDNYANYVDRIIERYQNHIAHCVLGNSKNGKTETINPCYQGFIDIVSFFVKQNYIIDIYTLNHDLLLESLLLLTPLTNKVSNGFGGEIKQIRGKNYQIYNTEYFNKQIRIYKLHGSIDIHELSYFDKPNKEYIQIVDGYSDANAFLIDNTQTATVLPLFLTGKSSKEKQYCKEPYLSMLAEFEKQIGIAERLIVIGYSGNDDGINNIIFENYDNWINAVIIAPDANNHPFVKNKQATPINKGTESLSLNDLAIH